LEKACKDWLFPILKAMINNSNFDNRSNLSKIIYFLVNNMTNQSSQITVGLGERSYLISVQSGLIDRVGEQAKSMGLQSPVAIITDDTVAGLYGQRVKNSLEAAGYESRIISFPAGESSKHLQSISHIYDEMVDLKPERKSGVIALGGGVPGDMAGFVAATYLRGMRFIQVPTTLLAFVDSSVGGKTGIDHPGGKNLIGAFHQPSSVMIDPETLKTLDARQVKAGLAEIIKHGVIADAELFDTVNNSLDKLKAVDLDEYCRIIPWNCRIKADVVEQDEKESGIRAILNFGHTFGHAIEMLTGFETYLHGEAVALGMLMEAQLGVRLGITPVETVDQIRDILIKTGYSISKPEISTDQMMDSMFLDKKVEKGKLRFIIPTTIGNVVIHTIEDIDAVRQTWDEYNEA